MLFFTNLPAIQTLEIITAEIVVQFVAVRLAQGTWNAFSYSKISEEIEKASATLGDLCSVYRNDAGCIHFYRMSYLMPTLLGITLGVTMVVVSFIVERNNRSAFLSKKVIQALQKQREQALLKEKNDSEALIHSILPPKVADVGRRPPPPAEHNSSQILHHTPRPCASASSRRRSRR